MANLDAWHHIGIHRRCDNLKLYVDNVLAKEFANNVANGLDNIVIDAITGQEPKNEDLFELKQCIRVANGMI
jgi:hypothetical protein